MTNINNYSIYRYKSQVMIYNGDYYINVCRSYIVLCSCSSILPKVRVKDNQLFHDWKHPTHNELLMLQLQYGFEPSDVLEAIEHVTQP